MIVESITYENPDGDEVTDILYFHLTQQNFADHIDKQSEFKAIQALIKGEKHTLSDSEVKLMMDFVKFFISISYGKRREIDGKIRFRRGADYPDVWDEFVETGAHAAYLMSLFKDEAKMLHFIINIMPDVDDIEGLTEEEQKELKEIQKLKGGLKADPIPPGTRIVDDVPLLQSVPTGSSTDGEDNPDFEKILQEARGTQPSTSTPEKTPISQRDHDLMRASLRDKPGQFQKFMETRVVDPTLK